MFQEDQFDQKGLEFISCVAVVPIWHPFALMRSTKASRRTWVQCEYKASRPMHDDLRSCVERFWRHSRLSVAAVS